jgi:uracil-DNA glycosylase family 4
MPEASLSELERRIVGCRACPRLVRWRETIARVKVARYRTCAYWGRPVPGFGDPNARLLVLGLAPGAHGANRTGRVFTGDRSGEFLFAALHRAGLATQAVALACGDGLALRDVYIALAVRCAPPDNAPAPEELARCAHFLDEEIDALPHVRVVLALGAIAWRAYVGHLLRRRVPLARPRPAFGHGALVQVRAATPGTDRVVLMGSYHVSQQNTQTRKLTPPMFDAVLRTARENMK